MVGCVKPSSGLSMNQVRPTLVWLASGCWGLKLGIKDGYIAEGSPQWVKVLGASEQKRKYGRVMDLGQGWKGRMELLSLVGSHLLSSVWGLHPTVRGSVVLGW